jgi:hypothetical protein
MTASVVDCDACVDYFVNNGGCDNLDNPMDDQILENGCLMCESMENVADDRCNFYKLNVFFSGSNSSKSCKNL